MEPLLESSQVAGLLKCSIRTVEDHARAGTLPGVKFGEGWVYPTDALMKAINRMAEEEAAKRSKPATSLAVAKPKKKRPDLLALAQSGT